MSGGVTFKQYFEKLGKAVEPILNIINKESSNSIHEGHTMAGCIDIKCVFNKLIEIKSEEVFKKNTDKNLFNFLRNHGFILNKLEDVQKVYSFYNKYEIINEVINKDVLTETEKGILNQAFYDKLTELSTPTHTSTPTQIVTKIVVKASDEEKENAREKAEENANQARKENANKAHEEETKPDASKTNAETATRTAKDGTGVASLTHVPNIKIANVPPQSNITKLIINQETAQLKIKKEELLMKKNMKNSIKDDNKQVLLNTEIIKLEEEIRKHVEAQLKIKKEELLMKIKMATFIKDDDNKKVLLNKEIKKLEEEIKKLTEEIEKHREKMNELRTGSKAGGSRKSKKRKKKSSKVKRKPKKRKKKTKKKTKRTKKTK
jgi:hypothetical protein